MKKASLLDVPIRKLDFFKRGRLLLETEIKNDPQNIEYRFLRLTIQENAPKFLKYDTKLISDKEIIINGFGNANKTLQSIIREYSNSSNILKENEQLTQ